MRFWAQRYELIRSTAYLANDSEYFILEGGCQVQYNKLFLRQNGIYTTPETAICCCYSPQRGFPATIEYTPVYQRSNEIEKRDT